MSDVTKIFAEVLRQEREKSGVSARDLALELGLPHHAIRDWEDGVRAPRIHSAFRWAQRLGYRIELRR